MLVIQEKSAEQPPNVEVLQMFLVWTCSSALRGNRTALVWRIKFKPHWSFVAVGEYSRGTALSPEETGLSGVLQSWPLLLPGWVSQRISAAPLVLHQSGKRREVLEPVMSIVTNFWRKQNPRVAGQGYASRVCTITYSVYFIPLLLPVCPIQQDIQSWRKGGAGVNMTSQPNSMHTHDFPFFFL